MITVNEARARTQRNINEKNCREQIEIEKMINQAIENCCFSITINEYLREETKKWLKDWGYKIESGHSCYTISWEE